MATEAADFFKHCTPVLNTSLPRCGALSVVETTKAETLADLEATFRDGDDWKIIGELLMSNFERKATSCGRHQNGWEDFLVSNIRNVKRNISPENFDEVTRKIRPFLLMDQRVPINNKYWRATNGTADGDNWVIRAQSKSGIPADVRSFQAGERIYIESSRSGTLNNWQGEVVSATLVSDYVELVLIPRNDNSYFDNIENPTTGIISRGPPVVGKYESYCSNEPAYLNTVTKDYWVQWTRDTICDNELTQEFFKYVLEKNPLYKKYFHLPKIEEARQRLDAFWSKIWMNAMWSRPSSANQNLNDYRSLPSQDIYLSPLGLGFAGGRSIGYKAENRGWMEQWQRCESIVDLQGAKLDMWSIVDLVYDLVRVRFQTGSPATTRVTAFCDKTTAELIDRGFVKMQNWRVGDSFRIVMDVDYQAAKNPFGFQFKSYALPGKGFGTILDVATHFAFDDYISEWSDLENEDMGRNLWFLDPTNFYLGVVDVERTTNKSGTISDLARVDPNYMCVQRAVSQEVALLGVGFTSIVECAQRDRLLRNFSGEVPEFTQLADRPNYSPSQIGYDYGY